MAKATSAARQPAGTATIEELEARLALLEQRLDPDADWERPARPSESEGDPLDDLFDEFHREDGSRIEPDPDDSEGDAFVDIMKGVIRPVTWSQLVDALLVVARDHKYQSERREQVANAVRAVHERLSILARLNSGPTNPADVAEAYVLGVAAGRLCWDDPKRAAKFRAWEDNPAVGRDRGHPWWQRNATPDDNRGLRGGGGPSQDGD